MKYQIIEKSNKFGDKRYYIYKKWWIFKWPIKIPKVSTRNHTIIQNESYFNLKQQALDYIDLQVGRAKYRGYNIIVGLDYDFHFVFLADFNREYRTYKFFGTYTEVCKQIDDLYINIYKNKYNKSRIIYETP